MNMHTNQKAEVRVVVCSYNEGKLTEVRKYFEARASARGDASGVRFTVLSPAEAGLAHRIEVEEDRPTLEGNAAKKAQEHMQHLPRPEADGEDGIRRLTVVVADDTALAIEALNGEPGIKVRRWADGVTSMTDEAIIQHCLSRMHGHTNRRAQFRSVVAMVAIPSSGKTGGEESKVEYFDGILDGSILEEADPMRIEGFPMESLFFVDEYGLLLGTIQRLPPEEKIKHAPSSSEMTKMEV